MAALTPTYLRTDVLYNYVPATQQSSPGTPKAAKKRSQAPRTDWSQGEAKSKFDKAVQDWLHHEGDWRCHQSMETFCRRVGIPKVCQPILSLPI